MIHNHKNDIQFIPSILMMILQAPKTSKSTQ